VILQSIYFKILGFVFSGSALCEEHTQVTLYDEYILYGDVKLTTPLKNEWSYTSSPL